MVGDKLDAQQLVRRRRVFYIPGYDPIHPRRYRELYRKESASQCEVSGYSISVAPKTTKGMYGWHVVADIDGKSVQTEIEALVWSDIVRASMVDSILATYVLMLRTVWAYIRSGAFWRLMQLRKGPVIAALYPVVMLVVQAAVAVAAGYITAQCISGLVAWLSLSSFAFATLLPAGMGISMMVAVLSFFKKLDSKFFVYYLMHDYSYSAKFSGAIPPELETRMAEFTELVIGALSGEYDEVLVVGHSSGAHIGISVLSDVIRNRPACSDGPDLAFLTLGQVVPMVSFLPDAWRLRADLAYLSVREEVFWLDVTAPGDGCTFALCDPVAVSGVAPKEQCWPLVISAAFSQTLSPTRWKELRWKFFRLHFQYLCAFDRPGDYDYFQITAGPQTLKQRFGGRSASQNRIEKPINKFTSVEP